MIPPPTTITRLVDAYEVGAIEIEDRKGRSEAIRARVERARRDLADAEHRLRDAVHLCEVVARLDDFAARVRQGLDTLSWLERRTIIRTLVAKIEIDEFSIAFTAWRARDSRWAFRRRSIRERRQDRLHANVTDGSDSP